MEPNTSTSRAAGTSLGAVLEHGEPSIRDPSLVSPAFSPTPFPSLSPASRSGTGLSWYKQIPTSQVVATGNGSFFLHAHAASSQSKPSSFPIANTFPMVGYNLFGNPKATTDTPLPTLLGGQWEQGELSTMAVSVLPKCPSPGMFGFTGESTAWQGEEMSSSFFFSPSFAGRLAPWSSDNFVGFVQPSSDYEMEPLPSIEEKEEIDVSAFLVSDQEHQLPNALCMATSPQMAGGSGGGGACVSRIAPGSTDNNGPPMLAPAAASTCTIVSTGSGRMACQSSGSSIGVTRSIVDMMMPSSSPVVPLVPPSPQGARTSSTNFNGFTQPSLSSVLTPHAPNLQGPLLPVKQEVIESVDTIACRFPDFISPVNDEEDRLYKDVIPSSIPGLKGGVRSSRSGSPSFVVLSFDRSTPIDNDNYSSSSMTKMSIRQGKMPSTSGLPPLPKAAFRTRKGGPGIIFTDREMAVIVKDKKLQEQVEKDSKRVKRILYNREYSQVSKVRKVMLTKNLEQEIVTLQEERKSLDAKLKLLEEESAALMAEKKNMEILTAELEQQTMLKDVVREGLKAEIQTLKHQKLTNKPSTSTG